MQIYHVQQQLSTWIAGVDSQAQYDLQPKGIIPFIIE